MRTLLSCVSAAILAASSNLAAAQNDGVEGNAAPPVQEPSANTAPDDAASVDDGNQGPGILVIGKRIADDEVRDYITNLLFPERVGFTKFYARQGEPLCPAVSGLELASKEYVIDRMRTVAKAAGIEVDDDEDCDFNLVLALVDDGAETIKRWRVKSQSSPLWMDSAPCAQHSYVERWARLRLAHRGSRRCQYAKRGGCHHACRRRIGNAGHQQPEVHEHTHALGRTRSHLHKFRSC